MGTTAPGRAEESQTRRAVRALTQAGENPRSIALTLGISTQAVYGHLKRIKDADGAQEKAS